LNNSLILEEEVGIEASKILEKKNVYDIITEVYRISLSKIKSDIINFKKLEEMKK
jgi:hypothetical protein